MKNILQGFFHHTNISVFQKVEGLFLHWRHEKISRGSEECCKPSSRSRAEWETKTKHGELSIFGVSEYRVRISHLQFAKRFGSLQICFCIFSTNCELLKSDTSWIFRVIHWTSYIVSYFKPIKYPLLNNNVISQRFIVHNSPN